jgi:hypothetical protein
VSKIIVYMLGYLLVFAYHKYVDSPDFFVVVSSIVYIATVAFLEFVVNK